MTSATAPADLRRRHLVGGGRVSTLADLLDDAEAFFDGPVVTLVVDYAAVSLGSTTGRVTGLISWSDGDGAGVVLGMDRSGRPCLEVQAGPEPARTETVTASDPVGLGEWHRFGLVVGDGAIELHVDGDLVGSLARAGVSFPPLEGVRVGCRHDSVLIEGAVVAEGVTGVVGDVSLTASGDGGSASKPLRAKGIPDVPPADVVAELARWRRDDPYRPTFHFLPPAHWMNEPHAPIEACGLHHLFFQSNRAGAHWGGIEWGHAVSTDLVRWRHLPPALSPVDTPVAPDGIWSGGSVLDDTGRPLIFLTAGDFARAPDQSVAIARPRGQGAATTWVADAEPVLRMPSRDDLVPGQFRDPFVWREGGRWFMLVGAGVVRRGGTALLFESADGESWGEVGPLLVGDAGAHPEVGEMWELPVLLPVSSASGRTAHVLLVCPWWAVVPDGRVVEVVHWLGDWDAEARSFTPWHVEPRRFDHGRHFTGPSGNVLSDGRTILWSIAQDGRMTSQQAKVGWAHNAGLPLELSLGDDDSLRIAPVRELTGLREEMLVDEPHLRAAKDPASVSDLPVGPLELDVRCAATTGTVRVDILTGREDELHASVRFDCGTGRFEVRRPAAADYDVWSPTVLDGTVLDGTGLNRVDLDGTELDGTELDRMDLDGNELDGVVPDGRVPEGVVPEGVVDVAREWVRLRVFLDGSMLEAYLGDRASITTRVRPPAGSRLRVTVPPGADLAAVRAWRLGSADVTPDSDTAD